MRGHDGSPHSLTMAKKKDDIKELKSKASQKVPVLPPQSEPQHGCNDVLFALIFVVIFFGTVGLACMYGKDVLTLSENQDKIKTMEAFAVEEHAKYRYALKISAVIAGGATVASLLWTVIMLICGKMLIW